MRELSAKKRPRGLRKASEDADKEISSDEDAGASDEDEEDTENSDLRPMAESLLSHKTLNAPSRGLYSISKPAKTRQTRGLLLRVLLMRFARILDLRSCHMSFKYDFH